METTHRVGGVRIVSASIEREYDNDSDPKDYLEQYSLDDPDPEIAGYAKADAERLEAWKNDVWSFEGIYARVFFEGDDGWKMEVRSLGLWGIESDSDDAYFAEVAAEEAEQLVEDLKGCRTLGPGVVAEVDRMLGAAVANL